MARLFVAHVEGGKQDPMAGVADAIEERRRRQVEEQVAREQLALQKTGLDLERQGLRLKRWEIAQQGVRQAAELESRERIAARGEEGATQRTIIGETGATARQESQQKFAAGEAQKARDFDKEAQELQRQFTGAESAKDRAAAAEALSQNIAARADEIDKQIAAAEKEGDAARAAALKLQRERIKAEASENKKARTAARKEARAERRAQMERLQAQIDSSEKVAQQRIDAEIAQLDKTIEADLNRLNLQLQDAKAARDDARVAEATKQIRQIEADRAAQVRAIQANKDQYQSEAASKASQQLRQLQHEERTQRQEQQFAATQKTLDRSFARDEAQKDRDARIAELDAQIAAAREEGNANRANALQLQRDKLKSDAALQGERIGAEREMQTERLGVASQQQRDALQAERDNLLLKLDEARKEGALDREAALQQNLDRIDAQLQLGEMQYGMPGGMAQDTVRTLDAQVESLDRIFDNLPEGQRPPQHVRERGKQALMDAREAILNARTRQEYNAAVTNAGALYQQYQQEMESAGQAVYTSRQTDQYNSLMEWASSDVGREHGITEARLAEIVTGDPAKRSEDISNLVKMKRGAEAFRRGELALEGLEGLAKNRLDALEEKVGPVAADGTYDRTKVSPVDRLAADALIGMNDVNLSMTERAAAAQTLIRYANMTEEDQRFMDLTLEGQRQEQAQLDLERSSGWVRSALAGPDGEYTEQDIMSSDFQDRLVALAAGAAGPNKRGIAAAASKALSVITEQDYAALGASGYRQLWADLGAALDPRVLQQLGREMSAVDLAGPSPAAPSGRVGQMLSGMRDRLTEDPENTDD